MWYILTLFNEVVSAAQVMKRRIKWEDDHEW